MFKRPNMDVQFKILIVLHHIILILGLMFTDWSYSWFGLTFLGWMLFGKLGGEIGYHRLCAHRSFKTTKLKKQILILLGGMACLGSSYGWCGTHRYHHRYSDTEKDPQSPLHNKWYDVWLVNWKPIKFSPKLVKDLLDDEPLHAWLHKYYLEFVATVFIVFALIDIRLAVFMLSASAVWIFHTSSILVDIVSHKWGYRNFDTSDNSRNNTLVNVFMLGSGLHNNHHAKPESYFYNMKSSEWDFLGIFIKHFLRVDEHADSK